MLDCCSASKGCGIWRHSNNRLLQNLQTPTFNEFNWSFWQTQATCWMMIYIYKHVCIYTYIHILHMYDYILSVWRFSIFALLLHPTKTARICMAHLGTKHLKGNQVLSHREERIIVQYTNLLKFQQKTSELMKPPKFDSFQPPPFTKTNDGRCFATS